MFKPVIVKQTLYASQLIKLKHVEDDELWREILSFREYESFEDELNCGFVPINYKQFNPNRGLEIAIKRNHVFLTREFIRLGADNIQDVLYHNDIWKSFESMIILLKEVHNLNGVKKCLCKAFIWEYKHSRHYPDEKIRKITKVVSKKFITKQIKKVNNHGDMNRMLAYIDILYK